MDCPVMTRAQKQHMLDVLAELYGQQYGVKPILILDEEEEENRPVLEHQGGKGEN